MILLITNIFDGPQMVYLYVIGIIVVYWIWDRIESLSLGFKRFYNRLNIKRSIRVLSARITRKIGQRTCDHCQKNVYAFIGDSSTGTRKCVKCCNKDTEDWEFKWENKNDTNQTVEYNAYKDGKKVGNTVIIHYFTEEQCNRMQDIREQIEKEQDEKEKREKD